MLKKNGAWNLQDLSENIFPGIRTAEITSDYKLHISIEYYSKRNCAPTYVRVQITCVLYYTYELYVLLHSVVFLLRNDAIFPLILIVKLKF